MSKKLFFIGVLIILGILFRTSWHIYDNVEFVTTAAIISGVYLGLGLSIIVPLIIMVITDAILGNTNIFLFTWSAYIIIGLASHYFLRRKKTGILRRVLQATIGGMLASLWFYLWTNFGVWWLDSWGMYSDDLNGLLTSYIMALPFLKYNFIGNILFVPLSVFLVELNLKFSKMWHPDLQKVKMFLHV